MLTRHFHATLAVAVLALAAIPVAAQVRGPSEITVPVGRLASVPLTIDADEADYTILGDIDGFREYDPDPKKLKLRVIGYTNGTAYVVVSSQKGGKLQPLLTVVVKVGAGPPIPPGPLPPDPPVPGDPLAVALKAAAVKDGLPPAKLADLALAFRVSATLASTWSRTAAEFQTSLAGSVKSAVPVKPPATWAVVQTALAPLEAILPSGQPDKVLSDADRAAVKELLTKLAASLEGAAK